MAPAGVFTSRGLLSCLHNESKDAVCCARCRPSKAALALSPAPAPSRSTPGPVHVLSLCLGAFPETQRTLLFLALTEAAVAVSAPGTLPPHCPQTLKHQGVGRDLTAVSPKPGTQWALSKGSEWGRCWGRAG